MSVSIGMAKPPKGHQKLILDLCVFLNNERSDYEHLALPEPNLMDGDQYSKQPDVLVVDCESETNLVAFEVEQKAGIAATIKKALQYVSEEQVKEAFVIEYKPIGFAEYKIKAVCRISGNKVFENETHSEVLDLDIADFYY